MRALPARQLCFAPVVRCPRNRRHVSRTLRACLFSAHTACTLSTCVPLLNPRTPGRVGSDFDIDKGEVYREVTHKGEYVNVAKRSEAWCRTARVSTGAKLMAVEHVL